MGFDYNQAIDVVRIGDLGIDRSIIRQDPHIPDSAPPIDSTPICFTNNIREHEILKFTPPKLIEIIEVERKALLQNPYTGIHNIELGEINNQNGFKTVQDILGKKTWETLELDRRLFLKND